MNWKNKHTGDGKKVPTVDSPSPEAEGFDHAAALLTEYLSAQVLVPENPAAGEQR